MALLLYNTPGLHYEENPGPGRVGFEERVFANQHPPLPISGSNFGRNLGLARWRRPTREI